MKSPLSTTLGDAADPQSTSISTEDNLFDFFHGYVGRAVAEHGGPVSEDGALYLTSLLVDRAHPSGQDDLSEDQTLVELRILAAGGSRSEALQAYRQLGDRALLTSGFFRQSLAHRLVSRDYYIAMGAAAYDAVAGLLRAAGFGRPAAGEGASKGLDDIYDELAGRFLDCSEVLSEVCDAVREDQATGLSDGDILTLYEEWLLTRSPRLRARLMRLGVMPVSGGGTRSADAAVRPLSERCPAAVLDGGGGPP